jgi:anti-sigma factor RsiW
VTCTNVVHLLPAYSDGELDLVRSLEVEQHLRDCPACSRALEGQLALRTALADAALYHRPPGHLRDRIRSSLRQARRDRPVRRVIPWRPLAIAAALAVVAVLSWAAVRMLSVASATDLVTQEVVSGHARFLLLDLPVQVKSSDQHEVKPWFNRKVGFAPTVKDLTREGFPLRGGRLEYLNNQKVAELIYDRHRHVINLFEWPAADQEARDPHALTLRGYHVIHWTEAGLELWAVSDLNEAELMEFVRLIRS